MSALRISERAIADLDEIWDYIADQSLRQADRLIERIHRRCIYASERPSIGMKRDDLSQGLRRILEGNYTIFCRESEAGIEVVRILHRSRDFSQHIRDDD